MVKKLIEGANQMSRLAKYLAKGSDKTREEWEEILKRRRIKTKTGLNFVELISKKRKGVIEIGCKS